MAAKSILKSFLKGLWITLSVLIGTLAIVLTYYLSLGPVQFYFNQWTTPNSVKTPKWVQTYYASAFRLQNDPKSWVAQPYRDYLSWWMHKAAQIRPRQVFRIRAQDGILVPESTGPYGSNSFSNSQLKYTFKGKLEYKPLEASIPSREYGYLVSVSNHWWAIELQTIPKAGALGSNQVASLKLWGDGRTLISSLKTTQRRDTGEDGLLSVYESDIPKDVQEEVSYLWLALGSAAYLDQVQTNRLRAPWSNWTKTALAEWKRFDSKTKLPTSMDYYLERPSGSYDPAKGETNSVKRWISYRTTNETSAYGMMFPKEFVFHAYQPFPSPQFVKPGVDLEVYRVSGSVEVVSPEVDHALLTPVFKGFAHVVDHRLGRESIYWLNDLAPLSLETLKTSKYSGEY